MSNTAIDLSKYITQQSENLWKQLNSIYDISVEYHGVNEYAVFTQNKKVIIYIPKTAEPCPDSFGHELLHVLVRSTETYIGASLSRIVGESSSLSVIISTGLLNHISNCLEHIKMLPLYLNMGFEISRFIVDYNTPKLTFNEVLYLKSTMLKKRLMRKTSYVPVAVDLYIGKYFAVKSCPNSTINYEHLMQELKSIDEELWEILESFWNSWLAYDIFKIREVIDPDYHEIVFDFTDRLEEWQAKRTISY